MLFPQGKKNSKVPSSKSENPYFGKVYSLVKLLFPSEGTIPVIAFMTWVLF
jgi:hypothetical protein